MMDNNPKDRRAHQMARMAIKFAIDNSISFSYGDNVNVMHFFFPKSGVVSNHMTYLDCENREELFTKMMAEAKELI